MLTRLQRPSLEQLARLCRHGEWDRTSATVTSGFHLLDAQLPGGGWPVGAVTELLGDTAGIGELQLLLPALTRLARSGRLIVWIAPPHCPNAPALLQQGLPLERLWLVQSRHVNDSLWAFEQALRCPAVGAALGWPAAVTDRTVRRLQLAAEQGGSIGILFRPAAAARETSPAALRLKLAGSSHGLALSVHKARGGRPGPILHLENLGALAVPATAAARA